LNRFANKLPVAIRRDTDKLPPNEIQLLLQNDRNICALLLSCLAILAVLAYHSPAQTTNHSGRADRRLHRHPDASRRQMAPARPQRPQPPIVTPGATFSQGAPPPSNAEVLFDGKDLSKWEGGPEQNPNWTGPARFVESSGRLCRSHPAQRQRHPHQGRWTDFQLHVEWTTPNPPTGHGQARGNSGILINDMYEIQVLDSYNDKTYATAKPARCMARCRRWSTRRDGPGEWQTYDINLGIPTLER